jgi:hypothetical protein
MKVYAYIKKSTGQFPLHEGDIRLEYPDISEDLTDATFPCPDTYIEVLYVDLPEFDKTKQVIDSVNPVETNGIWKIQWNIRDMTAEELANVVAMEKQALRRQMKSIDSPGAPPNVVG